MTTAAASKPSVAASPATREKAAPASEPATPTPTTTTTATTTTAPIPSTAAAAAAATRRVLPPPRAAGVEPLSDKATILLIRRTLCPQDVGATTSTTQGGNNTGDSSAAPIEDLLPPLTSRNDVDLQLYALLAVVVREFVLTWYSKITPDEQFVTEIVQIVAHCTRALEQRLRTVNLENLLFDELPELLDNHVRAYRASRSPMVRPPVETDPRAVYHALWPLPALSPVPGPDGGGGGGGDDTAAREQAANETAYRQLLVRGVLAVLLPTEDLENECLTSLVGQIFAELLIGNVLARRVAEPWMMWEIVGLLARLVREKMDGHGGSPKQQQHQQQRRRPIAVQQSPPPRSSGWLATTASPVFWSVLKIGFALFASLRIFVTSIALSRSLPLRGVGVGIGTSGSIDSTSNTGTSSKGYHLLDESSSKSIAPSSASVLSATTSAASSPPPPTEEPVPVLAFSLWATVSNLVQLDVRMPWLYGGLSMLQWLAMAGPGRIAALNRPLDRLLSHYLHKHALDPALLPNLLRSIRGAVFPGNKFGATPPTLVQPRDDQELAALKRRTAEAVYAVWSDRKKPSEAIICEIEGGLLDVFDDAYCNKHLLYGVVEAILVRLVPELAETGVLGLWEERLS